MAAGSSALAASGSFIGAGASIAGAIGQAGAARAQGEFTQQQAEASARMAEMQAEDSLKRGAKEVKAAKAEGRQAKGAQRAALAAQGIDVDFGSAADIQAETDQIAADNIQTIKNNAWREAYGFKVEAQETRAEGRFARKSAEFEARSTLLTGGLQAVGGIAEGFAQLEPSKKTKKKDDSKVLFKKRMINGVG